MSTITRDEALKDVKLYLASGWDLAEETPEYFLLKRNEASTGVHILIAVFVGWWLLFIPNIIYHMKSKKNKKVLKF